MTLNITVTTRRCIYQCADYRLLDLNTGKTFDFETQKCVLVNAYNWNAVVCFAGVGRTKKLDVGEWLAERVHAIQPRDTIEHLLDELQKANTWLSNVPVPVKRHSFSVGAFVGSEPVFALVSNFETPFGPPAATASESLSVFLLRPKKPRTFISGQTQAVTRRERKRLTALVLQDPEAQLVYSMLAAMNRRAADRTNLISPGCFTGHVRRTGEGGGQVHELGDRPFVPKFAIPEFARVALTRVFDEQFGPGQAQIRGMTTSRTVASDEYHEIQLREKPDDPNIWSNYGVFLKETKRDGKGAERAYRRAIELDANQVKSLGNLANLLWEKGDNDQAASHYRRALDVDPGNENVTWNYALFLRDELDDRRMARDVLDQGITRHPESGRLLLLRADMRVHDGEPLQALEDLRCAREKGADEAEVEACYAAALQSSGAPIGDCIGAYRAAIALNLKNGALSLNLAQLFFIKGDVAEANRLLQEAMRLGLDESAKLEAQFYLLCHTSSDPAQILRNTKSLLSGGARLRWNVQPNLEMVKQREPQKAALLELVSKVMAGNHDQVSLDQVLSHWPQN